jgi:hypothetical protein
VAKYSYQHRSDTELKRIRRLPNEVDICYVMNPRGLITEILELRRAVRYWEGLTHVRHGGKRVRD